MFAMNQTGADQKLRVARSAFAALAWLLTACIAIQTLLAGAAVFLDPGHWRSHVLFVRALEWLPILMLILAFPGKYGASMKWSAAALIGMVLLQYVTANVDGLGLLHPVIALFMFLLAHRTAVASMRA